MIYGKLALFDFTNELIGLFVTMAWAYFYPSVWALLGGAIANRFAQVFGSHILLPGIRNRFHWDSSAFKELLHFGKWIFFSSAIYLIYSQGDRMLLGKYLDVTLLGVYSVAIMLSETVSGVINKLNNAVIFPALSRVGNQSKDRLREVFYRARLGSDILFVMPIGMLLMVGDYLVTLLYDTRYHQAGWMLQILCVRLIMLAMLINGASCLFALGHSRYSVAQNICRAIWILMGIPIGWHFYGIQGVVWAVALTELPVILVVWSALAQFKLFSLLYEARSVLFATIGIVLGRGLVHLLP